MRTIAVTSGKGGVGKTNITANVGLALSALGKRVVLFDADLGLANLDVILGTKAPFTLQDVVSGQKRLDEVLTASQGNVRFVAGGSGVEALINLSGPQLEAFLLGMEELQQSTDILLFDTGAGVDEHVLTFLEAADEVLLVVTPDPASITDAYATSKVLFARKPDASIQVVMNMVEDEAQGVAVYTKLQTIASQFLGKTVGYAGSVPLDTRALQLIRKRRPFYLADRNLPASRAVNGIANVLTGRPHEAMQNGLMSRLRAAFGLERQRVA